MTLTILSLNKVALDPYSHMKNKNCAPLSRLHSIRMIYSFR